MKTPTQNEIETCVQTLRFLSENPEHGLAPNSDFSAVVSNVALVTRRMKAARKKESRIRDQEVSEDSSIRQKRTEKSYGRYLAEDLQPINSTSKREIEKTFDGSNLDFNSVSLHRRRSCYICKSHYHAVHHFYDALCQDCGEFNFSKRSHRADLTGRTALVTGGRIKIGFQIALKLLRAGASVVVTSRFPFDAAKRYQLEQDFSDWSKRLKIYSADFRSLPAVYQLSAAINRDYSKLDVLINNAAQTVRRPPEYYQHLILKETQAAQSMLPDSERLIANSRFALDSKTAEQPSALSETSAADENRNSTHIAALMTQACLLSKDGQYDRSLFPQQKLDLDGQQIDRRTDNSWVMELDQVEIPELLETHAVNSMTPFILIQQLDRLFAASSFADRYIVNVSAVEGQFNVDKTGYHPHTNMAKASMNMITKTCARRYARRGIYMNSVDTGWVTNEFPLEKTERMKQQGFEPPLDEIDGAARVCDPVFVGINQQKSTFGNFLKDYQIANW